VTHNFGFFKVEPAEITPEKHKEIVDTIYTYRQMQLDLTRA
jgi:hypothetical protein